MPTIVTVERATACKVYLESHFNELFSKASPRAVRLDCLQAELYYSKGLTKEDKDIRRKMFFASESNHLRKTRVLKSQTYSALRGRHNKIVDSYEVVKILGKGSFGIVRLVRHRTDPLQVQPTVPTVPEVYAMKVIRKSQMLKSTQEGHLRAERDFLVASEGSEWSVPLSRQLPLEKSEY